VAIWSLREKRITVETHIDFIGAKAVDEWKGVRCWIHSLGWKSLDPFSMNQDVLKLASVLGELFVGEGDTGEIRDFRNVDFNGHIHDGTDDPFSCVGHGSP